MKIVASKPVHPTSWMILKAKTRAAVVSQMKEEVFAKNDRETKRMERYRISTAIYRQTPAFRHASHTRKQGGIYFGNSTAVDFPHVRESMMNIMTGME